MAAKEAKLANMAILVRAGGEEKGEKDSSGMFTPQDFGK